MDTNKVLNKEQPQNLSPSNSGRRRCTDCTSSPEFEFWMLRNPIYPQPDLHSADELFSDGVLLPLHLLPTTNKPDPSTEQRRPDPERVASEPQVHDPDPEPGPGPESSPAITESLSSTLSSSKRWKDLFRKKNTDEKEKDKGKKKERRTGSGAGSGSAELNINIWPFSRSRSAGNAGTRPKLFPGAPTRKVNSAPCSRSNSAGESKSRKWPSSPGRGGVHVGRSSPVWQVRRGKNPETQAPNSAKCRRSKVASSTSTPKARVLNLNVPMCIGYRNHLSCRSDENSAIGSTNIRGNNGDEGVDRGSGSHNHFNLRNLFTKKKHSNLSLVVFFS